MGRKNYNVIIDGKNIFDQPVKNDLRTCDNIQKIVTGQGDNYTSGCLLDYLFFKKYYKLIATDLSKQRKLDAASKAVQQVSFTINLESNTKIFLIIQKVKETVLDFSKETVQLLWFYFVLINY